MNGGIDGSANVLNRSMKSSNLFGFKAPIGFVKSRKFFLSHRSGISSDLYSARTQGITGLKSTNTKVRSHYYHWIEPKLMRNSLLAYVIVTSARQHIEVKQIVEIGYASLYPTHR